MLQISYIYRGLCSGLQIDALFCHVQAGLIGPHGQYGGFKIVAICESNSDLLKVPLQPSLSCASTSCMQHVVSVLAPS